MGSCSLGSDQEMRHRGKRHNSLPAKAWHGPSQLLSNSNIVLQLNVHASSAVYLYASHRNGKHPASHVCGAEIHAAIIGGHATGFTCASDDIDVSKSLNHKDSPR